MAGTTESPHPRVGVGRYVCGMTDRLPDLPWPLNTESAARYVAEAKGIEVTDLTLVTSTETAISFRAANGMFTRCTS